MQEYVVLPAFTRSKRGGGLQKQGRTSCVVNEIIFTSYPQFLETFPKPQDFEPQVGVSVFRDKGLASALSSVPSRQRFGIPPEEIIPLVGEPGMVVLRWLGSFRAED